MRNRVVWLTTFLLVGFIGTGQSQGQVVNLLPNGGFETGSVAPYGHYGAGTVEVVTNCDDAAIPDGPVEGDYCLHVVIPAGAVNNWDSGMTDGSFTFEAGKYYTFSAFVKSKDAKLVEVNDVKEFLTWMAVKKKVSASSQNIAFNSSMLHK